MSSTSGRPPLDITRSAGRARSREGLCGSFEGGKMDELTLPAERKENLSPVGIMAAARTAALATCVLFFAPAVFAQPGSDSLGELLVGKAAFGDWRTDAPLVRRKITDLPPPYATRSASNPPRVIAKPASAAPRVPPGFQVELFVSNLRDPRTVRVAPNGDIFIAESEPGRIRVLRAARSLAFTNAQRAIRVVHIRLMANRRYKPSSHTPHDIGYVRGVVKGDKDGGYVVDGTGRKISLPRG